MIEENLLCAYCRAPGLAACDRVIGWLSDASGRKDLENPEAFLCSLVVCSACVVQEAAGPVCPYHARRPAGSTLLTFGTAACVQGNLRLLAADGGLTKRSVTAPPVIAPPPVMAAQRRKVAAKPSVPVAAVTRQASLFD
jgi:hypothetical protein